MGKIKTAVIGVGYLGKQHARIFHELEEAELKAVCDINKETADKTALEYKCRSFYNYKDILKEDINCVSIAVPTPLHFEISKFFLEHKKDILVEKPFTSNLNEAYHLIKIAEENNLILQVGHIERFNCAIQEIKKIIHAPKFIECHRLGPYPNRGIETSVVLDLMIHDLDIILHLVNEKIKSIDAIGLKVLSQSEDIANVRLKFENGCVCNITASRISTEPVRKIRFFQKDTYISLDYIQQEVKVYTKNGNNISSQTIHPVKQEQLKNELRAFIDSVTLRKDPCISAQEAAQALSLAIEILDLIKK